ncbi:MAG: hypothetical protein ABW101_04895 [Candidatus Thiodiazotropha sp.]
MPDALNDPRAADGTDDVTEVIPHHHQAGLHIAELLNGSPYTQQSTQQTISDQQNGKSTQQHDDGQTHVVRAGDACVILFSGCIKRFVHFLMECLPGFDPV